MSDTNKFKGIFTVVAALVTLSAAGCGDGNDYDPPPTRQQQSAKVSPPPSSPVTTRPAAADALTQPDGLAAGGDSDPLAHAGGQSDADDALASPSGPKMPTDHSHWLRGRIFGAHVGVRLNGVFLGDFSAPIDKDITMKLHSGVNTVTFSYRPMAPEAGARLELLESEHAPPIPPLATFVSPATAVATGTDKRDTAAPLTQTVAFLAR